MDVNRDNFYDVLPTILQDINEADFVAFDGEFTGILPFDRMNYFDTPAERYQRHYDCDRHYLMVQVGLAMVRCTNAAEHRYTLKAYNFYLFPENELDAFDFRSKSSSLQFLAANHFDFAQLFLKGIPFVCKTTHLEKMKNVQQAASARRNQRQMENGNATEKKPIGMNQSFSQPDFSNMSDADILRTTMTGFSEVMWKLQESGKPVVGHNLHMDALHIINQFFTPIPAPYDEYKTIVKALFPKFIDTKTISSTSIFQNIISNTALNALYRAVREPSFPTCHFETPENFRYDQGEREHTAGYDASCTAICMTKLMAFIAEKTNFKENPIEHTLIDRFVGKLFYMRSFDLKYSDLLNDDDLPDRSGVFYIKHGGSMTTSHLRDFLHTWNLLSHDRVDPTTYAVGLSMKNDTVETMLGKLRANDRNLTITPYAEYHHLDASNIKVKEPNHLFDVDPAARKSNRRPYVDKDAVETSATATVNQTSMMEVETSALESTAYPLKMTRSYGDLPSAATATASPTIAELIEQKEKASGKKKRKLFDYNDEW